MSFAAWMFVAGLGTGVVLMVALIAYVIWRDHQNRWRHW